jgi:hypothetical protein
MFIAITHPRMSDKNNSPRTDIKRYKQANEKGNQKITNARGGISRLLYMLFAGVNASSVSVC